MEVLNLSPNKVEVVEGGKFHGIVDNSKLTFEQKLKLFDPVCHGGEVMAVKPKGAEIVGE